MPLTKAAAEALLGVLSIAAVVALPFAIAFPDLTLLPSDATLRTLATVGVGLLIAYSVLIYGHVPKMDGARESWLGFVVGLALSAAISIALTLTLAEIGPPAREITRYLHQLALWFCLTSFGLLAITVAIAPLAVRRWLSEAARKANAP